GGGPGMRAIEEEPPPPHVDGLVVLRREVIIEPDEEQLLDLDVAIRCRRRVGRARTVEQMRIGHRGMNGGADYSIARLSAMRQSCYPAQPVTLIECIPNVSEG